MKYNNEAFNISSEYYQEIKDDLVDNNEEELQNKVLQILLRRLKKKLEENGSQNNGIVRLDFISPYVRSHDGAYYMISELIESHKFDSFASQYCIYLGELNNTSFEIIWDYKTYFESISMSQIGGEIEITNPKHEFVEAIAEFKQLPREYQKSVLESFSSKVKNCKKEYLYKEAKKICSKEGHQFSKWERLKQVYVEDTIIDHQRVPGYRHEYYTWERTCTRCGSQESVKDEPQELIAERKEKNKQRRIKRLERELKILKEEV